MQSPVRSRLKAFDVIVVVAVLVVSAVLMRGLLRDKTPPPVPETLSGDLRTVLAQFYEESRPDVQLTPLSWQAPVRLNARISLQLPGGAKQRRPEWTYSLCRFVALHHPEASLGNLSIVDAVSQQALPETTVADPGGRDSLAYQEAARSELMRRSGQSVMDSVLGVGHSLFLVDVKVGIIDNQVSIQESDDAPDIRTRSVAGKHEIEGRPEGGRPFPVAPRHPNGRHKENDVTHLEMYLILSDPLKPEVIGKLEQILKGNLHLVEGRGDTLKVIVVSLPKLPPPAASH